MGFFSNENGYYVSVRSKLRCISIYCIFYQVEDFFCYEFTSIDLLVCGYVSFLMYLSFPFLLKRDVIFIKKGQRSMYQRGILMYLPRIKRACVHHKALPVDSFAGCAGTFSSHHLRSPCKSLRKMFIVPGSLV